MEDKKREQLHRILDIVFDVNGYGSRSRNQTGTLPTVFLNFSGHVGSLQVELVRDGWVSMRGNDKSWEFRTGDELSDDVIDAMETELRDALGNKKESDVLARDIERKTEDITMQKQELARMKKELRKLERKGK